MEAIKSTIEQLGQEADKLRNEIALLKAQKQDLDTHSQSILALSGSSLSDPKAWILPQSELFW